MIKLNKKGWDGSEESINLNSKEVLLHLPNTPLGNRAYKLYQRIFWTSGFRETPGGEILECMD